MENLWIESVTDGNIEETARIHADAWRQSHKGICSEEFVQAHTTQSQIDYIKREMARGRMFYLLRSDAPKGVVSICGRLIENLYVAPEEQRKGYGTMLLRYAESRCRGNPVLWILSSNTAADSLYRKCGYIFTGRRKELKNSLFELEMTRIISK